MGSNPFGPETHRPLTSPSCPLNCRPNYWGPVPLIKFRIALRLNLWYPQGPRIMNQHKYDWVSPKLPTRTKLELRCSPLPQTSYTRDGVSIIPIHTDSSLVVHNALHQILSTQLPWFVSAGGTEQILFTNKILNARCIITSQFRG